MDKNIIFIGFMGCGKTTLGKRLSREINREFIDMDKYIEQQEEMKISHIFEEKGEAYFREVESQLVKELYNQQGLIIATGGGVIKNEENILNFKKTGTIVYLEATPEHILRNLEDDNTRPLLEGGDKLEKITKLMEERKPLYEKYADVKIKVGGITVKMIVEKIIESLEI